MTRSRWIRVAPLAWALLAVAITVLTPQLALAAPWCDPGAMSAEAPLPGGRAQSPLLMALPCDDGVEPRHAGAPAESVKVPGALSERAGLGYFVSLAPPSSTAQGIPPGTLPPHAAAHGVGVYRPPRG